ncbi:hypothetical protein C0J52_05408 [Blattella germanica]|nr:hypothetical protein C0J52_05408 [Blattella germanica]
MLLNPKEEIRAIALVEDGRSMRYVAGVLGDSFNNAANLPETQRVWYIHQKTWVQPQKGNVS